MRIAINEWALSGSLAGDWRNVGTCVDWRPAGALIRPLTRHLHGGLDGARRACNHGAPGHAPRDGRAVPCVCRLPVVGAQPATAQAPPTPALTKLWRRVRPPLPVPHGRPARASILLRALLARRVGAAGRGTTSTDRSTAGSHRWPCVRCCCWRPAPRRCVYPQAQGRPLSPQRWAPCARRRVPCRPDRCTDTSARARQSTSTCPATTPAVARTSPRPSARVSERASLRAQTQHAHAPACSTQY